MQIFDKHLFDTDAKWFREACKVEQKKWILENTNQKDESLIEEFLNSKMNEGKEECQSCKDKKNDSNISKGNDAENATINQSDSSSKSGIGDSPKRPKKA